MRKIFFVAFAMIMAISGCKAGEQSENRVSAATDDIVKETRNVGKFSGITLIGSYKVICTPGKDYGVVVEATKGAATKLLTEVKNGMLTISKEKIAGVRVVTNNREDNKTTIYVTLPQLQDIKLIGSGDIIVKGKVASDNGLRVSLSGSGDIELDEVTANYTKFSLAGSGDVKINNVKGKQTELQLAGSGDMVVKNVDVDHASINLAGSGDMKIAGTTDTYSKIVHGYGKLDDNSLKYNKIEQVMSNRKTGTVSPNGIEAQP